MSHSIDLYFSPFFTHVNWIILSRSLARAKGSDKENSLEQYFIRFLHHPILPGIHHAPAAKFPFQSPVKNEILAAKKAFS